MSAKKTVIDRAQLKRGDTPVYVYNFTEPYAGFDWSSVVLDCALTNAAAPNNNTAAAALRLNQPLQIDADNNASYRFQLTIAEAKSLIPGSTYIDECQLRQNNLYVTTPITGKTPIAQDYII